MSVARDQRHLRNRPCEICGGWDEQDRGKGKRCSGYTSGDGLWCRCSRDELAGGLQADEYGLYRHRLRDECRCGARHGPDLVDRNKRPIDEDFVATYDYRDETGRLVFQVLRKKGKGFVQRKPDGSGGWIWKLNGAKRVLYRLPELIASKSRVYFVEGEKDVETLRKRNLTATTSSGGAKNWKLTEANAEAHLAGREVTIIADADKEGRSYASQVARALTGYGCIVTGPLECTKGKDITEHLAAGGSLDDLKASENPAPIRVADWRSILLTKKNGVDLRTTGGAAAANVAAILSNDPKWAGVLAYDEFAETIVTLRSAPCRPTDEPTGGVRTGDWTDDITIRTQCWLADAYGLDVGAEMVLAGVLVAAQRRRLHPVRDWLESLRWDGTKRLPTWIVDVMGADDTPYVRAVGQNFLVACVARVMQPGCKVDTVPIFEGAQGIGKSRTVRALAGDPWHLEMSHVDLSNKDSQQILRRKWIVEMPEIDGLSRQDSSRIKSYFSTQVDTYRPSYGKGTRDFPRQCCFVGTTNAEDYLRDETGGRRFWPVKCRKADVALVHAIRDQLWAEARARYESGEAWHVSDPELADAFASEQETRYRTDLWESRIADWLTAPPTPGMRSRADAGVTLSDVLSGALQLDVGKWGDLESKRAGAILRRLGWAFRQQHVNGAKKRIWRPIQASEPTANVVSVDFPQAEPDSHESYPDVAGFQDE